MTTSTDIDALATYARTGDPAAFAVLSTRYRDMVYATCLRVLRSSADAEDAAQDTFFKLARSAASIQGNVAAWLHACAHGTSLDLLRKRGSQRRAEQTASAAPHHDDPSPWRDVEPLLDDALAKLSEQDRHDVVAHYLAGRSQRDLAREAGVSAGTMSRRIDRALDQLATHLRASGVIIASTAGLAAALGTAAQATSATAIAPALAKVALADAALTGKRAVLATSLSMPKVAFASLLTCGMLAGGLYLASSSPPIPPPTPQQTTPQTSTSSTLAVPRPTTENKRLPLSDYSIDGARATMGLVITITAEAINTENNWNGSTTTQRIRLDRRETTTKVNTSTLALTIASVNSSEDDPFQDLVGKPATLDAELTNDACIFALEIPDAKHTFPPITTRRPQGFTADPDNPLHGTWLEIPNWTIELTRDTLTLATIDKFVLERYRVISWTETDTAAHIEAICVDNVIERSAIGKRTRISLATRDGGRYLLAISPPPTKSTTTKPTTWPSFTPSKGDNIRVLSFDKETP